MSDEMREALREAGINEAGDIIDLDRFAKAIR